MNKKCLSVIRYMKALPWVEKGAIIWCGRYIREDLMRSYFQCGLEREDNLQWSNSKEGIRKGEITCIKHIMLFHFAREN